MMNWHQLLSGKRFGMEDYHGRAHERTDFQRDYDRLIFSSPFRRLQNKTQVFPSPRLSAGCRTRRRSSRYPAASSFTTD